ncbi:MAG: hypothetical protein IT204_10485 [Fimbriimonadaceae bacterium]|nr:hypothetical protein [Fimbriimonadaceae bacterium]
MRESLGRELLELGDSLPAEVACPFCSLPLPAWPAVLSELRPSAASAAPPGGRRCPRCGSRSSLDGEPLLFGDPYALTALGRGMRRVLEGCNGCGGCLAVVATLQLVGLLLAFAQRLTEVQEVLFAIALAAVIGGPLLGYQPWRMALARRRWWQARTARLSAAGAGDVALGADLAECDLGVRELLRQVGDRSEQLVLLRVARDKLEQSSFRDRSQPYHRAIALLEQQIAEREGLLEQFLRHRRDLDAVVAVRRAEAAFDPGQVLLDSADLTDTRRRLTAAVDRLAAEQEVAVDLGAL